MSDTSAKQTFATGAVRTPVPEAFHVVCPELERRVVIICAEGIKTYPDDQVEIEISTAWRGLPLWNILKHAKRHWNLWLSGDRSEDHLAKVAWAVQQIMHQESKCNHVEVLMKDFK